MISINRILVATDFSEHGEKALRYGTELAMKFGAELHLLHAVAITPVLYGEGGNFPYQSQAELEQQAAKQLDQVEVEADGSLQVVRYASSGTPFVEIVRYAKENTVDLIVMGTHGRGAIAHMLMGSVAEKVVSKAPCPVLVVRDQEHDFVMP
jgi:nucleotide-binding universal stress UspA family protein